LEIYTAPRLREALEQELAAGRTTFLVNLEGLEFIDSTGLSVLKGGCTRAREQGGDLGLICTQSRLLRPFQISGLDQWFRIYATEAEATAAGAERSEEAHGNQA